MNQKTIASKSKKTYKSHLDLIDELEEEINSIEAPMWDDMEFDDEQSRVLWFEKQESKLAPLRARMKEMKEVQSALDAE